MSENTIQIVGSIGLTSDFAFQWIERSMRSRSSEFCDNEVFSVFTATWNVAGSNTTVDNGDFSKMIFPGSDEKPITQAQASDIYSLAFQETVDLSTMNVVFDDSKALERSMYFQGLITQAFEEKGLKYQVIARKHLVGEKIITLPAPPLISLLQSRTRTFFAHFF